MKRTILRECFRRAMKKNPYHPEGVFGCFRHYSFFIQGNKILEMGLNRANYVFEDNYLISLGYSPVSKIHSELDAYHKSKGHPDFDLNTPFECVNLRLLKDGTPRDAAPCEVCTKNLLRWGAKTVYYSTNEGFDKLNLGDRHVAIHEPLPV